MEKEVRNAIERATQRCRRLLEEDFAEQLAGTFDVLRDGTVAAKAGSHLGPRQVAAREKIVAAIEHKRGAGFGAAAAVADYLRDAAFTTLNRFAALKMLEARGLVQECISKFELSSGYREYCGMAPGIALLPAGAGYRLYIESLFDELSTEVKVLFDRRDPASVLWPKRASFEELLALLNVPELAGVWDEDETIGWVYQFFNAGEERKKMRDESQAPRNSRELAIRNQFFTPRYVVEFLVDNTLGRIWCDMRSGRTILADRCKFLIRQPGEMSEARPIKDPRDIRVLDPACGSGHFLIYAFDLLLTIYLESYSEADSPSSKVTGNRLAVDFPNIDLLRRALPGLILAHNLHGVEIDARCVQIAQLSLWLRAQRAFGDFGIERSCRSMIRRVSVVTAEPMPGDRKLRESFERLIEDIFARDHFSRMVEALQLAGELGVLLRLEELLSNIPEAGRSASLFSSPAEQIRSELSMFAAEAELREKARRRIFRDDALHGFGLVEICESVFDAIVMNPPFGDAATNSKYYLARWYKEASADLGAVFLSRGLALLAPGGKVGVIANRTLLSVQGLAAWRERLLSTYRLEAVVDFGSGVLDATVETFMAVWGHGTSTGFQTAFLGLLGSKEKSRDLLRSFESRDQGFTWRLSSEFAEVPGAPLAYWVPAQLLKYFRRLSFLKVGGQVSQGTATADDFRFYRLRWEVNSESIHVEPHKSDRDFEFHVWSPLAKGGEYALWWDDIHLLQNWALNGLELRNFVEPSGKPRSFLKNLDKMFERGCTYPYRTVSALGMRLLPPGVSFSVGGWAVLSPESWSEEEVLAVFNSRIARYFMEVLLGQGDSAVSGGTAARNYVAAAVGGIPWPAKRLPSNIVATVQELIDQAASSTLDETGLFTNNSLYFARDAQKFSELLERWWAKQCDCWSKSAFLYEAIEKQVIESYELKDEDLEFINTSEGKSLFDYQHRVLDSGEVANLFGLGLAELTGQARDVCGPQRFTVKKAYFVDRTIDLACHILRVNPHSVISAAKVAGPYECSQVAECAGALLSWILGRAIGRFAEASVQSQLPSRTTALPRRGAEERGATLDLWVDDPGQRRDILNLILSVANQLWGVAAEEILTGAISALGRLPNIRAWYRTEFFAFHILSYSKSRRKAPVYWQISTPSASFSVWLYLHTFTKDTFFTIQHQYVGPKYSHEEQRLRELRNEIGPDVGAADRRRICEQEEFVEELRNLLDEVKRVTPLWNPRLDDGVVINFSLLWRLVPQHKAWQKELKSTWEDLCMGKYDWAHLAMHLWPGRVVPKCAEDRSLAIAHGLKDEFWYEDSAAKLRPRKEPTTPIAELIAERSSPAVKAALDSLLQAPGAAKAGSAKSSRKLR